MRERLEEHFNKTLRILEEVGFAADRVFYPYDRRSIDIVAYNKSTGLKLLVKVADDSEKVKQNEISDLKKAARGLDAKPIIVANRSGQEELDADTMVLKKGISVVNPELLKKYFGYGEKPIIARVRGSYIARINPKSFKEEREKRRLSLGHLAELIGVSRKAIYDYEHGKIDVSILTAIRIAEVLGENVFEGFDPFYEVSLEDVKPDNPLNLLEEEIFRLCGVHDMVFYRLSEAPMDYVLRGGNETYSITLVRGSKEYGSRNEDKIQEAERVTKILEVTNIVIEDAKDIVELKRILKR